MFDASEKVRRLRDSAASLTSSHSGIFIYTVCVLQSPLLGVLTTFWVLPSCHSTRFVWRDIGLKLSKPKGVWFPYSISFNIQYILVLVWIQAYNVVYENLDSFACIVDVTVMKWRIHWVVHYDVGSLLVVNIDDFINWLYQLFFCGSIETTLPVCLLEGVWLFWVNLYSQTVQAQGAEYLRSKELRILSRETQPTKNRDCTGSNLFREGIKKRNERMLQDLRTIQMIRELEPDSRCAWCNFGATNFYMPFCCFMTIKLQVNFRLKITIWMLLKITFGSKKNRGKLNRTEVNHTFFHWQVHHPCPLRGNPNKTRRATSFSSL